MHVSPVRVALTGRIALVTGANTGIGKVTARELARAGARVFLACRNEAKARLAMGEIQAAVPHAQLEFLSLDLGSLAAVREAAAQFLALGVPLHLLVNNAGLGGAQGATSDGFEIHFGTNHLGHFLLTLLLADKLKATAAMAPAGAVRVVTVSSRAHFRSRRIDWAAQTRPTASLTGLPEYSVSKLANVLFSKILAERLQAAGISCFSVHPGVVASDVWRRLPEPVRWLVTRFMISNDEGALTSLHCATDPGAAGQSGLYWSLAKPQTPWSRARDPKLAAELWQKSLAFVGLTVDPLA